MRSSDRSTISIRASIPTILPFPAATRWLRVVREIGGRTLAFLVSVDTSPGLAGFVEWGDQELCYETSDCSGSAFLPTSYTTSLPVPRFTTYAPPVPFLVVMRGTHGVYQSGSAPGPVPGSRKVFFYDQATCEQYGGVFTPPDECCQPQCSSSSDELAEAGTVDLATLSLVPPFHVEGP